MLKVVAQVYDPLGWISPVVITMKILFQKLCMDKEEWDTPLKKEHRELFERWINDLEQVGTISISKCYFQGVAGEVKSVQLHGFSDASDAAYAATIYIRIETDVNIKTSLIASKTKVAPISSETTPRLELLGAYFLARLISSTYQALQETIHIDRTFCWVDSTAALFGLKVLNMNGNSSFKIELTRCKNLCHQKPGITVLVSSIQLIFLLKGLEQQI